MLCVSTYRVYISRDVVFDEGIFPFSSNSNSHDHPSLTDHSTCQPFPLASPFNANLDVGDDHMINELSNVVPFEFSGDLMQPHDVGIQLGDAGAALPGAAAATDFALPHGVAVLPLHNLPMVAAMGGYWLARFRLMPCLVQQQYQVGLGHNSRIIFVHPRYAQMG